MDAPQQNANRAPQPLAGTELERQCKVDSIFLKVKTEQEPQDEPLNLLQICEYKAYCKKVSV